jgi:hypothetical protein
VIVAHVKAAKTEFQSVKGLAAAASELDRQMFTYDVTVPVNSQGTVYMPGSLQNIYLDGISIQRHPDVHDDDDDDDDDDSYLRPAEGQ